MPIIQIETVIYSTQEICFDLSRSIDLHKLSTVQTNETAIDGITSGLIGNNEFVTWRATHFGIRQNLTSHITQFSPPVHFRDEQLKGAFQSFQHDHFFVQKEGFVLMKDSFEFESPFGFIGKFVNAIFLTTYMRRLLIKRNELIKQVAESEEWKHILSQK